MHSIGSARSQLHGQEQANPTNHPTESTRVSLRQPEGSPVSQPPSQTPQTADPATWASQGAMRRLPRPVPWPHSERTGPRDGEHRCQGEEVDSQQHQPLAVELKSSLSLPHRVRWWTKATETQNEAPAANASHWFSVVRQASSAPPSCRTRCVSPCLASAKTACSEQQLPARGIGWANAPNCSEDATAGAVTRRGVLPALPPRAPRESSIFRAWCWRFSMQ